MVSTRKPLLTILLRLKSILYAVSSATPVYLVAKMNMTFRILVCPLYMEEEYMIHHYETPDPRNTTQPRFTFKNTILSTCCGWCRRLQYWGVFVYLYTCSLGYEVTDNLMVFECLKKYLDSSLRTQHFYGGTKGCSVGMSLCTSERWVQQWAFLFFCIGHASCADDKVYKPDWARTTWTYIIVFKFDCQPWQYL